MFYSIKQFKNISRNYSPGSVLKDKLLPFKRDLRLFIKNKPYQASGTGMVCNTIQFIDLNPLMPVEILSTEWKHWNEPDFIKYKSASGGVYIVQNENLLIDINTFMQDNLFNGRLPYLHIKGKDRWECYRTPDEIHILEYLWAYFYNYDIYTEDGELVQEENKDSL